MYTGNSEQLYLVYKGGDILTSLSWALGRMQLKDSEDGYIINMNQHCDSKSKANVLREAGDIVNDLIHAEITKQSSDQIYAQNDPHELNIDKKITMVDPQLWAFHKSVTRTIQERNSSSKEERNAHKKTTPFLYFMYTYVLYKFTETNNASCSSCRCSRNVWGVPYPNKNS